LIKANLAKNFQSGGMLAIISFLLLLISYPVYLSYLGSELYGIWAFFSIIISLSQVGELGINESLIKYIASSYNENNKKEVTQYATSYLVIFCVLVITISLLIGVFRNTIIESVSIPIQYSQLARELLLFTSIMLIFIIIGNTLKGIVSAIGRIDYSNYTFLWLRIVQVVLAIILLFLNYGIWSLLISNFTFYSLNILFLHKFLTKRGINYFKLSLFSFKKFKTIFSLGSSILISRISQKFFIDELIKLIIIKNYGLTQLTYFEIAFRSIQAFLSIVRMSLRALLPYFSSIDKYTKNGIILVKETVGKVNKVLLCFVILFIPIILFFYPYFAKSWLNDGYDTQITINFRVLLIGYILNIFSIPIYHYFISIGKKSVFIEATILSLCVFILGVLVNSIYFGSKSIDFIVFTYAMTIALSSIYYLAIYYKKRIFISFLNKK
jgi:O-antigen/teichoic acid export membrane protein